MYTRMLKGGYITLAVLLIHLVFDTFVDQDDLERLASNMKMTTAVKAA
jgi:hypothetical protein